VDAVLVGTMLGIAFAAVDLSVLSTMDWDSGVERLHVLTTTVLVRFTTGFVLGALQIGVPGWLYGIVLGGVLSLPLLRVDRAPRRALAMGLTGGLWVGVLGAALRQGVVLT